MIGMYFECLRIEIMRCLRYEFELYVVEVIIPLFKCSVSPKSVMFFMSQHSTATRFHFGNTTSMGVKHQELLVCATY